MLRKDQRLILGILQTIESFFENSLRPPYVQIKLSTPKLSASFQTICSSFSLDLYITFVTFFIAEANLEP